MRSERGFSLIEALMALGFLGLIAVGLLYGLSTAFKTTMVSQERVVAESLAKSQFHHINIQDYIGAAVYNPDDPEGRYELVDISQELVDRGYEITVNIPQTIVTPSAGSFDLQSITVVIKRNGEELLTISDYKVGTGP